MDDEDRYARITLRIPKKLHAQLSVSADRKSMSLNAEIVNRLEATFAKSADPSELAEQMAGLSKQLTDAAPGRIDEIHRLQGHIEMLLSRRDSLYNRLLLLDGQRLTSATYRRLLKERDPEVEKSDEYKNETNRYRDMTAAMMATRDQLTHADEEIASKRAQLKVLTGDETPDPEPAPEQFDYLDIHPAIPRSERRSAKKQRPA